MGIEGIKKDVKTVRELLPELLNYFEQTKESVKECQKLGVLDSSLKVLYHNHRRYKSGKRKGKTPMEIFTGQKQEKDWIELFEKKKPDFFL